MSEPECVFEIEIRATPEAVWEAITSPDWTRRYFHDTAVRSSWQPGAKVVWELPDGSVASEGELLEVEFPRRIVHTWLFHYDPALAREASSRVSWEIEDLGDRCRLTVVHDRLEGAPKTRDVVRGGWAAILAGLRDAVTAA